MVSVKISEFRRITLHFVILLSYLARQQQLMDGFLHVYCVLI
jgi:hypothetical protein